MRRSSRNHRGTAPRSLKEIPQTKGGLVIDLVVQCTLRMKHSHSLLTISRDHRSLDRPCCLSLCPCSDRFLYARFSHSVLHDDHTSINPRIFPDSSVSRVSVTAAALPAAEAKFRIQHWLDIVSMLLSLPSQFLSRFSPFSAHSAISLIRSLSVALAEVTVPEQSNPPEQ